MVKRQANVKDVAAAANVSPATVSNVLNGRGRVSAETAARVHAAIRELQYVRNDAARQLRVGSSRSIGLAVIDLSNPYFVDLARGADRRARQDGLQVVIGNSDRDERLQDSYISLFAEQRMRGVLVSPIGDVPAELTRIREHGTRAVLVDRDTTDPGFPSVSVDDIAGGYLAVRHLLDLGRRRIAFIGSPATTKQAADRLEGARAAVGEVPSAVLTVVQTEDVSIVGGRAAGVGLREIAELDGIFTANDLLAVGVLQSLANHRQVPEDIAVIGYDDIELTVTVQVPLSSIRQPTELLGYTAVDLLLREPHGFPEEHVIFQPELVVRASTSG